MEITVELQVGHDGADNQCSEKNIQQMILVCMIWLERSRMGCRCLQTYYR
jgi:hypothetical protein